jgi:site-specific DNA-methyltransferase (adenine-specific)
LAAAEAIGYSCIAVERYADYYDVAVKAIPRLCSLKVGEGAPLLLQQ